MDVRVKKTVKYVTLPGILPRIRGLLSSGFVNLAIYIAYLFRTVRLLPYNHEYFNPKNHGRFGVTHVLAAGAKNIKFSRQNIDQICIYSIILFGIVALFLQVVLFILAFVMPAAFAGTLGADWDQYFGKSGHDPTYDIAYTLLDRVFGFADIFGSCVEQRVQCRYDVTTNSASGPIDPFPNAFHIGLHAFFRFYNLGLLAIGMIIVVYTIAAVVGETAQSGTPFGKRFNGFWGPVRLIIAMALLVPIQFGMNTGQYLVLQAAKIGSNFGTNTWEKYRDSLSAAGAKGLLGSAEFLVATPEGPPLTSLNEFIFTALVCKKLYQAIDPNKVIEPYVYVNENLSEVMWNVSDPTFTAPTDYAKAAVASLNDKRGSVTIFFGEYGGLTKYETFQGRVKPYCGEITMEIKDGSNPGGGTGSAAIFLQALYYDFIKDLWRDDVPGIAHNLYAENLVKKVYSLEDRNPNISPLPDNEYVKKVHDKLEEVTDAIIDQSVAYAKSGATDPGCSLCGIGPSGSRWDTDFGAYGWGGAAIWYNTIAEVNGALVSSAYAVPIPNKFPEIMETVYKEKLGGDDKVEFRKRFLPGSSDGFAIEDSALTEQDIEFASILYKAQSIWFELYTPSEGNVFADAISALFGLEGLLAMEKNMDIHPLAQLSMIGRGLVESAITNFGYAFGAGFFGGFASFFDDSTSKMLWSVSAFTSKVATVGLTLGFILYYVIPFLPFIYFFFAVGGWVKGVFEAYLGAPLWALAHIRVDGEGLPGPKGKDGYFLIFEIVIRPALVVFGLILGIWIFGAQVQILNEIWPIVTSNVSGFNSEPAVGSGATPIGFLPGDNQIGTFHHIQGAVSSFFFTIIYTIIVYMIGMACFKLVDLVPNNILRWMGEANIQTFNEGREDPAGSLVQYSFFGTQTVIDQMGGAVGSITSRLPGNNN
jgi:conjugal transfer/type IV secretion protein DotA/TraY